MRSPAASADLPDLPALKVLARARAEGRMPHAVLLTGADGSLLARAAEHLAAIHLGEADPLAHPDCRVLRPAGLSRIINVEAAHEVVVALGLSSVTERRVVVIHEPDRLNTAAANCLLKTLEEPPPGTLIVLQTANYYRILPTILSRCMRFHLAGEAPALADASWNDWLREMEKLLTRMVKGPASPNARVSEVFIPLYALCARFEVLLDLFVEEALKAAPAPPVSDDDQEAAEKAHEATIARGVRARMLVSVEEKLRLIGRAHPACVDQVALAVGYLEDARHRMELNYQVLAAFEQFLLRTLRAFAVRPREA
jgi:DNA polymerase-3 subunit delta'